MRRGPRALISMLLAVSLPGGALAQQATPERPVVQLSLDEAVKRALENNVDIKVEEFNPLLAKQSVREAEGFYDPSLFANLSTASRTNPATNVFAGAASVQTDTQVWNFGANWAIQTGGSFGLTFNNNKQETNSVFSTLNPLYNSSLALSLTQPLLRDFKADAPRTQLRVSKKNQEISDIQFLQTVTNTVASVKQLYYDLLFTIDNLEAQRKSLALARKLLEENQVRVRVGTMAPLDVVAAESEVAARESAVIVAEGDIGTAEDALKRALFPRHDDQLWALRIVPTERPTFEAIAVDATRAIERALQNRTDMNAQRRNLEIAELNLKFARGQALPTLDLVSSYGVVGVGGTAIRREGLGGPILEIIPGGYGDALSDVFGKDFPTWSIGVSLSYPIGNRQADAQRARAQIALDQTRASLARLELQVAAEVRAAARNVEVSVKRVESTRAARVLRERQLDAEEKRFAAGMSTNFLVTQAQRDLSLAEVEEVRAVADYRKNLVTFERVQEAGGGAAVGAAVILGGSQRTR